MSKFAYAVKVADAAFENTWRTEWVEGCPIPDAHLNRRPVYFGDVHFDTHDACDSYFESVAYADTDSELSDDELDQLTESQSEYIGEQWQEWYAGMAEAWADRDR